MRNGHKFFLITFLSFLGFIFFLVLHAVPLSRSERLNLLLVSVDTLRADYLSCYGGKEVQTRNADALAERGVLFTRAFAHNPLTLPSHVTMLTGVTPLFHGVHENLGFRLPEDILTLAEHLKASGYHSAAFVGSFPLDSRFGLARGFDTYDDLYGEKKSPGAFFFVERRGEEVVTRALEWLGKALPEPWFLFLHLFDPHQPYAPPSPYSEEYASNLYAGEVAYADECLGRLFRHMKDSRQMEKTLVVFTSDHGESLGEHGELTHGYFAYNSTLHIPLIISNDRLFKKRQVVEEMVSHVDLFPTICDLLGVKTPRHVQGSSLLPLMENRKFSRRPIYFESLSAYYNRNWAPLRGIILDGNKYIDLPIPELYDLEADFKEERNLTPPLETTNFEKALSGLRQRFERKDTGKVKRESKSVEEAMKSLGYIGGAKEPGKRVFTEEDDLKSLLPFHLKLMDAASSHSLGEAEKAVRILEELISQKQDFITAYEYLANVHYQEGNRARAIEVLEKGVAYAPGHAQMRGKLGIFLSEAGDQERAIKELMEAISLNAEDAELWNYLGVAHWKSQKLDKAEEYYLKSLSLDQNYASAFNNLGSLHLTRNNPGRAMSYFDQAILFDPSLASAYNGKAVALGMKGDLAEAVRNWEKAVSYEPDHQMALYNLGTALVKLNRPKEALPYLEKYLEVTPPGTPDREKVVQLVNYLKNLD